MTSILNKKIKMKNIIGDIAEFEYRLWIGEQLY